MDFFELVKLRRSIRTFENTPVEETKLNSILQATNRAPSAGNLQAYDIFAVRDPLKRRELANAALHQDFISSAPLILVFCAHPERSARKYRERGASLYSVQDATIACTFALLAAAAVGLGTVWVGAFDDDLVWQVIGSPKGVKPVAILPIGYPAEAPEATSRRSLDNMIHDADS